MKAAMPKKISVRAARGGDEPELVRCLSEWQSYERRIEPRRRPGDQVPQAYMATLKRHCRQHGGSMMVAEADGRVAGFVYCFPTEVLDDQANEPAVMVSISDLVVGKKYMKLGVDRLLIEAAENFARQQGAVAITVGVQAGHKQAIDFYTTGGYAPHELTMIKPLR